MTILEAVGTAWVEGGWGMRPVLVVFVIAVGIIIERALWFRRSGFDAEALFGVLEERVRARDVGAAISRGARVDAPVMRVALAGLTHLRQGRSAVEAAVRLAARREAPRGEKRIAWLPVCAWAGALLGFLGTFTDGFAVFGINGSYVCWMVPIGCHSASMPTDPTAFIGLTSGFACEAMRCAQFGLLVALVAWGGHALLSAEANARRRELDAAAAWVVALADTLRAEAEVGGAYR